MTRDGIERRLRTEPAPDEAGYSPRPLPGSLAEARELVRGGRGDRRRLSFVSAAASVLLLVIAAGAAAAWLGDRGPEPGGEPGASSGPIATAAPRDVPTPTPSAAACRATDFAVTSDAWDSGAGSRGTRVVFGVLDSVAECTLGGVMDARITDAAGAVLVEATSGVTQPRTVLGGDQLEIGVAWSNWCGQAPESPLELSVTLPGDDTAIPLVPSQGTILVPPCMGSGQGSNLSVTGFETSTRPAPEG